MKGLDFSCTSPASTAICVSLDQKSMIRSSSRAIDRHTPRLIDSRRTKRPPTNPPSSHSSTPKPKSNYHQKPRKSSAKQTELTSPPGSTRYLLSDTAFFDVFNDFDPVSALVPVQPIASSYSKSQEAVPFRPAPPQSHEQVVVLRVSLHCKGCEGKVRKHISRMEGVKSFNIDFSAKKVTVVGDVTPLGVLASISRVKNAQFWPSPPSSRTSSSSSSSSSFPSSLHHTVLQR